MKTKCFLWASVLCTLLDGCKVVSTSEVPESHQFPDKNGNPSLVIHGMPYFLPIGVITIKGDWKDQGAPPPKANLESGLTFGLLTSGTAPAASKDDSDGAPAGQTVTLTFDGWTITITAEVEADPGHMFYAIPRRNYIFDDYFQVTVNSKHLLSAGKSTANDRTADVIGAVASLVESAAAFRAEAVRPTPPLKSFLVSFRTDSWTEWDAARKMLKKADFVLAPLATSAPANLENLSPCNQEHGLVFRLAEPYTLSLTYPLKDASMLRYEHVFVLPGRQPYVIEYHRVAFVKKVQEVGFTDGMLTDYRENLPSPILGVLGIPKAIIGAIVPFVGGGSLGGTGTTPAETSPPGVIP